MKTQNTLIAHPKTTDEFRALKAFMEALDISFEVSNESPYDPDFVAKIQESRQQAREGKTVQVALDDIWKE